MNITKDLCNRCGSELVLITSKTSKITQHISLQTVTTYRCTNEVCQGEIDKRIAENIKFHQNQAILKAKRMRNTKDKSAKM